MRPKQAELIKAYGLVQPDWSSLKELAVAGVLHMLNRVRLSVQDTQRAVKASRPREVAQAERRFRNPPQPLIVLDAPQRVLFWRASHALLGAVARASRYWRRVAGETSVEGRSEAWTFLERFEEFRVVLQLKGLADARNYLGQLDSARRIELPKAGPSFGKKKALTETLLDRAGLPSVCVSPLVPGVAAMAPGVIRLGEKEDPLEVVTKYVLKYGGPEIVTQAVKRLLGG